MADVDFSNAVIETIGDVNVVHNNGYAMLNLVNGSQAIVDNLTSLTPIVDNFNNQVMSTYPKYMSVYSGTFNTSGTEFYIVKYRSSSPTNQCGYRYSNINFNAGDTFSFIVSAEIET